jgi:multidrug resistance efflux pump
MAARRKYNVKGTKDFVVLAGIFFFLCLWAIKDAWYPSPKVLEKHPLTVEVSFEADGSVGHLYVMKGDSIVEEQILADLRRVEMDEKLEASKQSYSAAKEQYALADNALRNAVKNSVASEEIAELKQNRIDAQAAMDSSLEEVTSLRAGIDATELHAPTKGVVQEVLVSVYDHVAAGDPVMVIDPADHFYLFNKSLAIFSFIAFWLFLGIHVLTR